MHDLTQGQPGLIVSLAGRTAIVTGGSRGIGRACALILARAGAKVAVHYHARDEDAREVVWGIGETTCVLARGSK